MPCYDGREREDQEDNRHMGQGASLLCEWMRRIESAGGLVLVPPPICIWWEEHKQRDAKR